MEPREIEDFVEYQKDHWKQCDGYIESYDIEAGILKANGNEFTVNKNAAEQILERLNLKGTVGDFGKLDKDGRMEDAPFMQKAIARKIDLGQKSKSRIIFDEADKQAKAVKSVRYNRIFNYDVYTKAMDSYKDKFNPTFSHVDDDNMILSFGDISSIQIRDDRFDTGIQAWNSETGNGSLGVGQMMIRFACTNGMVGKDSIDVERMSHSENDLMLRFLSAIKTVADTKNFQKMIEKAMSNTDGLVPRIYDLGLDLPETDTVHPRHRWEFILSKFKIPSKYVTGIIQAHLTEPMGIVGDKVTAWGIYNAVSRYATHIYPLEKDYQPIKREAMLGSVFPLLSM